MLEKCTIKKNLTHVIGYSQGLKHFFCAPTIHTDDVKNFGQIRFSVGGVTVAIPCSK